MLDLRKQFASSPAFRFLFLMSVVSLFADMTYEGARSLSGPFLAHLGASGLVVGLVAGLGELVGFALRYVAGTLADRSGAYWATVMVGYIINLLSVPSLALARAWPLAAGLLLAERMGRGVRKPVVSAMLSHTGSELGHGWVFGFHEAMDQTGATLGPLLLALILALHGTFQQAFAALLAPALAALVVLTIAQRQFPSPRALETARAVDLHPQRGAFLLYVAAGAFLAAGFADFALLSYHLSKTHILSDHLIPALYAVAMLAAGAASPLLGHAYDRHGIGVTIAAFIGAALAAPLIFLGSSWCAFAGVALWGLGMGAQDALLPPMIARIVPPERRATALGTFDACYGAAWFLGSAAMGWLYDRNVAAVAIFSLCLQLIGAPLLGLAARREV